MIQPRTLKGFRDFLPEKMILKKHIIRKLENVFENFGFSPIDTPALEYTEILLGKGSGETDKQIYRFQDNGGRDVALRFDLTIPLARYVSSNFNQLILPFKRYHIAPVWRGENTAKGRFREFYQCDIDIIGSESINADMEILLIIKAGFDIIDCGEFIISVNHRGLLNAVLDKYNLLAKSQDILRTIDKIYKIGYEDTIKEMEKVAGIESAVSHNLLKSLNIDTNSKSMGIRGEKIFDALNKFRHTVDKKYYNVIDEMQKIFTTFKKIGILDYYAFNPAITRGLDYYTGIVFESFITESFDFGSMCSGGRYDNLTGLYSKNNISGVGASFGLDRILAMMEANNNFMKPTVTELLIFNLNDSYIAEYFGLAEKLRACGIKTEVILKKQKIANQFKLAEKKKIHYVLVAGEDEFSKKKFNLKDIVTGEEKKSISLDRIVSILKG